MFYRMRAIIACSASIRSVHLSYINKQKMSDNSIGAIGMEHSVYYATLL